MSELTPPPIGLRPRYVVELLRIQEILEAAYRYSQRGKRIPDTWLAELSELNARVADK